MSLHLYRNKQLFQELGHVESLNMHWHPLTIAILCRTSGSSVVCVAARDTKAYTCMCIMEQGCATSQVISCQWFSTTSIVAENATDVLDIHIVDVYLAVSSASTCQNLCWRARVSQPSCTTETIFPLHIFLCLSVHF